jgi:hypothetical protein
MNFHLLSINIHKCLYLAKLGDNQTIEGPGCSCKPVEPYPVNKYFMYSKKINFILVFSTSHFHSPHSNWVTKQSNSLLVSEEND